MDGGRSWRQALSCLDPSRVARALRTLLRDPVRRGVVYAGVDAWTIPVVLSERSEYIAPLALYRSQDGGKTWRPLLPQGEALAVDPAHPATLYATTADPDADGSAVLRSDDDGRRWRQTATLPRVAERLVDPVSPRIVYAATRQGVWRSRDAGGTWQPVTAGLARLGRRDVRHLVLDPRLPHHLYAAVAPGLFELQFTDED